MTSNSVSSLSLASNSFKIKQSTKKRWTEEDVQNFFCSGLIHPPPNQHDYRITGIGSIEIVIDFKRNGGDVWFIASSSKYE